MSEDEYTHQLEWMDKKPDKLRVTLCESAYDLAVLKLGPNCGYDPNKVEVIRGYPKFE